MAATGPPSAYRAVGRRAAIVGPPGTREGADRDTTGGNRRRPERREAVVAELVEAVILVSIIFLMGLALGVVAAVIVRRDKGGPRPP